VAPRRREIQFFTNVGSQVPPWAHSELESLNIWSRAQDFKKSSPENSSQPAQHQSDEPWMVAAASQDPGSFSPGPVTLSGWAFRSLEKTDVGHGQCHLFGGSFSGTLVLDSCIL
jgi:hypothetical protein